MWRIKVEIKFGLVWSGLVWYDILTILGYLMPNPLYTHTHTHTHIYDM